MSRTATSRTLRLACSVALASGASHAGAQDLIPKAPAQESPIAITGATIHPISGPSIGEGWILFDRGLIAELGPGDRSFPAGTQVIDASGMHVYPGLIAPSTQIGLTEIAALRQTADMTEHGEFNPEVLAAVAVNPDSTLIPVTRANGILTFASVPTGGAVPGRLSVMSVDGWTWEDMAIKRDAGLAINWPSMRPSNDWWADEPDAKQMERIEERLTAIDEIFRQAIGYRDSARKPRDLRLEAMLTVIPGADGSEPENPVFISASDVEQITAAVTWAVDLGLRPVITGGVDAPLAAELLRQHDVPVIVTGTHRFPKRADQAHDAAFTLPAELTSLGIRWCMASTDDSAHERNLPYNVSKAVAYGLEHDEGLRGLTLSPAQILEIDHLVGSLEPGKQATLIVTTGSPLEITSTPVMAFVQGRQILLESKQSELARKYREKYRQLGLTRE